MSEEAAMRPPVAPYLTVSPAMAAIAFYTAVFGAQQKALMPALDGLRIMHCELLINGGSIMLADAFPEFGNTRMPIPGEPVTMSVSLEFATGRRKSMRSSSARRARRAKPRRSR